MNHKKPLTPKISDTGSGMNRRHFIIGAGLAATASTISAGVFAMPSPQEEILSVKKAVMIVRQKNTLSTFINRAAKESNLPLITLNTDPVRQWRDEIEDIVIQNKSPLIGFTNWSDYLMIRGLAAELRYHPHYLEQHSLTELKNWPTLSSQANDLLKIAANQQVFSPQEKLLPFNSSNKTLFSWVII